MKVLKILVPLILLSVSATASAAAKESSRSSKDGGSSVFYFGVNFAPIISQSNDSIRTFGGSFGGEGPATTSHMLGYDARITVAPVFFDHIIFGLTHNILSQTTHRPSSANGDTTRNADLEQREWGTTLGFLLGNWQFKVTWLFYSSKVDTDNEANHNGSAAVAKETKNYDGRGWEFEFGYAFELLENLFIGPNLVYRRVHYDLQSLRDDITHGNSYYGKPFEGKADEGSFDPMILMVLKF